MLADNEQLRREAQQEAKSRGNLSSVDIRSGKKRVRRTLLIIIVALGIIFLGFRSSLENYRVSGATMEPIFHDQQTVWVNKLAYLFNQPQRGDVIIFTLDASSSTPCDLTRAQLTLTYIGRIVGIPGDAIVNTDTSIIVNGSISYTQSNWANFASSSNLKLGANQYYVLENNLDESLDSRCMGPISRNDIIGQVIDAGF